MDEQQKQLLFKDLCARLPYGVKIHIDFTTSIPSHIVGDATLNSITSQTNQTFDFVDFEQDFIKGDTAPIHGNSGGKLLTVDKFKPYLRPMSSMTEEEINQLDVLGWLFDKNSNCIDNRVVKYNCNLYVTEIRVVKLLDWIYSHHFDVNGLIESGLALEAHDGMYCSEYI